MNHKATSHDVIVTMQNEVTLEGTDPVRGSLSLRLTNGSVIEVECGKPAAESLTRHIGEPVFFTMQVLTEPFVCRQQHCSAKRGTHL